MRLLLWLKRQRSLVVEKERLEAENARLRYDLATALIASWMRLNPSPEAHVLPEKPAPRRDPHPVQFGRHHRADTEIAPRRQR